MTSEGAFLAALSAHDNAVRRAGLDIWLGAEPTFTDASAETSEWLFSALGPDKLRRAQRMLRALVRATPGCVVLRPVGKFYPGEARARWNLGYYYLRDGTPLWNGPPDPLVTEAPGGFAADKVAEFAIRAASDLVAAGFAASKVSVDDRLPERVVFHASRAAPQRVHDHAELARPSVHRLASEALAQGDRLAENGTFLIVCGEVDGSLYLELPAIPRVDHFIAVLRALGETARSVGAQTTVLSGFAPPVDASVGWETLAPDPAVVEVNVAPASTASELYEKFRRLHEIAVDAGLSPYRLQYNGVESDSGGGGQITLGGPTAETSPFFKVPGLLPSMVRYFNRHPSLSYLYATPSVGSASQAPRPDEGQRDAVKELALTLELLRRVAEPSPEIIWRALSPFMTDPSGNTHRAEINIEKLWNPFGAARGRMGVVEFRALRMGRTAQMGAALAVLMRAVVAMLAIRPDVDELTDWGDLLHQRFALPFALRHDIDAVLGDLERAGFGLGEPIKQQLLNDEDILIGTYRLAQCKVEVRRANEFWPLVGDVAVQQGGSRNIDASTSRVELRLVPTDSSNDLERWDVGVAGWAVRMHEARGAAGVVRVIGLRYRTFLPQRGLHPTLSSQDPLRVSLIHPKHGAWRLELHDWHPQGHAYEGLPTEVDSARKRRRDRLLLRRAAAVELEDPHPQAVDDYTVDLRWQ